MYLIKSITLSLILSCLYGTQTTNGMSSQSFSLETLHEATNRYPQPITEFKEENLGKIMSVLGLVRNVKLVKKNNTFVAEDKPLFTNFHGGEWVIVPLECVEQQPSETKHWLCAAIFNSFVMFHEEHCLLITQKIRRNDLESFVGLNLPLTDIYLVKRLYTIDTDNNFIEYTYPLEKNICTKFNTWLENYSNRRIIEQRQCHRRIRAKKSGSKTLPSSPLSAPLLPNLSPQDTEEDEYEILYIAPSMIRTASQTLPM